MWYILTTNPGLEDIVEEEIIEKGGSVKHKGVGRVVAKIKNPFDLKTIYHVIRLYDVFSVSGLDDIYENVKNIDFDEMKSAKTFRITSERHGNHEFTSLDIQKIAGKAVDENYRARVSLKNFDVNIRVDVIDTVCYVGVQLTKDSLHKRYQREEHPSPLNPVVAHAMLRLSSVKGLLHDPFCGGGTIPIEASLWFDFSPIIGSDIRKDYVEMAKRNAERVGASVEWLVTDARDIKEADVIVTNPPYGRRFKQKNLNKLYREVIKKFSDIAEEIILITLRKRVVRECNVDIVKEIKIDMGGLHPSIYVIRGR